MKVQHLKVLNKFIKKHKDSKRELENWFAVTRLADWDDFDAILIDFPKKGSAVHAKNNTKWVLFKFGNRYRMDVYIKYEVKTVMINRIDTHEGYNKWKPPFR